MKWDPDPSLVYARALGNTIPTSITSLDQYFRWPYFKIYDFYPFPRQQIAKLKSYRKIKILVIKQTLQAVDRTNPYLNRISEAPAILK
jgi:pyruvate/2-oxoacid:ferredoxin oxidoreductase alpha subunit